MEKDVRFISTKLKMPIPRKNYIKREVLIKKLDNIMDYKITLIKGGAGSGKTTLMSTFFKEKGIENFKWISLDSDNDDIHSFWYYFLEAIRNYLINWEGIMELFKSMISKGDIEDILAVVINEIIVEKHITIVLDDFHCIRNKNLLESIRFFIKYSSENIHIILISREGLSMYLADFIMSGMVLEINEGDLKLSLEEGKIFLTDTLKLAFDGDTINKINTLAEGWIGGLQLAALAAVNSTSNLFNETRVLNKYMVDYLSREILEALNDDEKEFLIKTSILSYFNEDICNRLFNKENCGEIIQDLMDRNLFIIKLHHNEGAYRYHNLLGGFLKLQFFKLYNNQAKVFYTAASEIFQQFGDFDESIKLLFEGKLYDKALKRIEQMGQNSKGWTYLCRIPLENLRGCKDMLFQRLFYHFCNLELTEVKDIITLLEDSYKSPYYEKLIDFTKALLSDDAAQRKIISANALTFEEIDNMKLGEVTKAIVYIKSSIVLRAQNRYEEAFLFLDKAASIAEASKNPFINFWILNQRNQLHEELGELLVCEQMYREAFNMMDKNPILSTVRVNIYMGITGIHIKSFDLSKAIESLNKTVEIIGHKYESIEKAYLYNLMEINILKGDKKETLNTIDKLKECDFYEGSVYYSSILKCLIILGEADDDELNKFAYTFNLSQNVYTRVEDKLLYSRIMALKGKYKDALDILEDILENSRRNKIRMVLIEAIIIKVSILTKDNIRNRREILNLLREAVHYSYKNRILSPYALEGKSIMKYLVELKEERVKDLNIKEKNFINEVLGLFNNDKTQEILSHREIEVLSVLATGASNKEIGESLCISLATVKTHIINIYSKLQVSNRIEAIERAREKGVI